MAQMRYHFCGKKKEANSCIFVLSLGIFLASFWIILFFFHPLPADKLSIAVRNSILPSIILVISSTIFLIGRVVDKRKKSMAYMDSFVYNDV